MIAMPRAAVALALLSSLSLRAAPPDEDVCKWCENDPERLAKVGAVTHGPMPFAKTDSDDVASKLPSGHGWTFLETEHIRFASNLGPSSLKKKDLKELEEELAVLREAFVGVPDKPKKLDPQLRLHMLALRCERFYARFQEVIGVTDEDFPETRDMNGPYMGNGRYLGESDKFEIIWHASRTTHHMFTLENMGFEVTDALRWHFAPQHKVAASVPAEDSDLRFDPWLYPHTVHQLSHMMLCAYKHFSYDPPVWLDEGLAHYFERSINPMSTTQDGVEGTGPHRGDHQDWEGKDAKLVRKGKAPTLAQMMRLKTFGDLTQDLHVAAWSMVTFLVEEHPEGFAKFVGGVKGQLDSEGYPTGQDLPGLQRELLKEAFGWTPAEFDEAWQEWAKGR